MVSKSGSLNTEYCVRAKHSYGPDLADFCMRADCVVPPRLRFVTAGVAVCSLMTLTSFSQFFFFLLRNSKFLPENEEKITHWMPCVYRLHVVVIMSQDTA